MGISIEPGVIAGHLETLGDKFHEFANRVLQVGDEDAGGDAALIDLDSVIDDLTESLSEVLAQLTHLGGARESLRARVYRKGKPAKDPDGAETSTDEEDEHHEEEKGEDDIVVPARETRVTNEDDDEETEEDDDEEEEKPAKSKKKAATKKAKKKSPKKAAKKAAKKVEKKKAKKRRK